ncbi:hypothetical protein M405DRAFT_209041 [Rhizopogon salebrosus TDB-379]|nr:hypothetical protein M405DRAFT_209041 [Rhizopogon salebrosus TDB-379]
MPPSHVRTLDSWNVGQSAVLLTGDSFEVSISICVYSTCLPSLQHSPALHPSLPPNALPRPNMLFQHYSTLQHAQTSPPAPSLHLNAPKRALPALQHIPTPSSRLHANVHTPTLPAPYKAIPSSARTRPSLEPCFLPKGLGNISKSDTVFADPPILFLTVESPVAGCLSDVLMRRGSRRKGVWYPGERL